MTVPSPTPLPGGLLLRTARPEDLDQIQQLLVDRGEEADARDVELMLTDTEAGWDLCAVVTDGDRVVSTASLMDETIRFGGLELPAGQVELVATAVGHEGRGLVRALMTWAHELSAARGHLVQAMIGIPYFYRLFGYEYAVDIPHLRPVAVRARELFPDSRFRPAVESDVADLARLQDLAQSAFEVSMPHSGPRRRWLLAHDSSTTYVVERAGRPVATGRVQVGDEGILLAEAAAEDGPAAAALLSAVAELRPDVPLQITDRPGTVLDAADPGPVTDHDASQYYVRVPDPARLLDALRPLLFRRLGMEPPVEEIVLSTFGRHYRMPIGPHGLGPVATGGPMQGPASLGGAGVAPDQLGGLIFGAGMAALTARRPDVYTGPHRELFEALFPAVSADLLTFYLPY